MKHSDESDGYIRTINTISHKTQLYLNNQLKDLGLTSSTYFFILKVGDSGELSQDQLFKLIYLNPSNVTRRLNRLIKLGYISKEKSAVDGRSKIIKLTKLGYQNYEKLKERLPQINNSIVSALDRDQLVIFKQLMAKMEARLDGLL
ncbi:transcriptional regulator [Paucilactobacillus hokkaidonensis JCM 18461]|uniref:Transcriptional regulator n=2 Tax=Paucilactobacillus hokkaidonensis TaxID=1193095 RepID=A0A0A1GY32_9LACO|nr:MarR family transcriptional regulator [Paucilactobacillus hokkaidonensis]KRO10350.1 transcriptional regulator [Paucilactobacillus hokkaidonensis]BAP85804.1 transcriptional regulator [Paucilactobacillus hokkaidonensis JCM 18461]